MLKHLKKIYLSIPILPSVWRGLKNIVQNDPLATTLYTKVFENGKLSLDWVCPETLSPPTDSILFPVQCPLHAGEDAPLADMLFLLNLAKGLALLEFGPTRKVFRCKSVRGLFRQSIKTNFAQSEVDPRHCGEK